MDKELLEKWKKYKKEIDNKPMITKNCKFCNLPFIVCNDRKVYCSNLCYHKDRLKEKVCVVCKKKFMPQKGHKFGQHCSNKCRMIYHENKTNPWVEVRRNESCYQ